MELKKETMRRIMLLILYTVVLLTLALRLEWVFSLLYWILRLLLPFLLGGAIAFVLNVPMRFIENMLAGGKKGAKGRFGRPISLSLAIFLVLLVLGVVCFLVIPQLADTLLTLKAIIPEFFMNLQSTLEDQFSREPELWELISGINLELDWKALVEQIAGFVTTGAGTVLSSTLTAAASIASGITTFGIAFVFAVYILLQKENLARQFKKLFYAYFPERAVNEWIRIGRMAEQTFSRFLAGQCVEAAILGAMFFVTLTVFRLPYALLIGVLIAFTALIPIFGAFIGCAVGIFLMLVADPVQAIWFTVFFFVLQQIEGNLIYPHVVGNSVGLPSIWVLAAVSVGGSMMGVVGMLIFIPLCSVVYALIREDVGRRLCRKAKGPLKPQKDKKDAGA